jgi:hypothetical protein
MFSTPGGFLLMAEPKSHRVYYPNVQGRIIKNFNLPGITHRSAVAISAGPYYQEPGGIDEGAFSHDRARLSVDYPPGWPRAGVVLGSDVYVTNICPHGSTREPSGVEFILHVDSAEPIDVAVTITVFDEMYAYDWTLLE